MKAYNRTVTVFISILFLTGMLTSTLVTAAPSTLIWEGEVSSSGVEVLSPILEDGKIYRIVVAEMFWYDFLNNLAADAQYYTTDPSDSWNWGNHFPAPGGHSFVQINGEDVDWGPFSNGDTGHMYTIYYTGEGAAIAFKIVDWMDGDYDNNVCHLPIKIYETTIVGGEIYESIAKIPIQTPTILAISFVLTVTAFSLYKSSKRRR